ncbi:MAG: putative 4-hydroxybenzoate polyprenyltransferase [Saprospiraceae bacterium]|nr:putative 4-hydroxybenzoate polyprenyltransferase [Saprospiraceae bacterium]MCB9323391.1 UbiA family prenyltransferase [Lewinellaceae bacterium]
MKQYFSLIKFSHTIFALPFALLGFFLAYLKLGYFFSLRNFGFVILCMIFARSAAMAFNRFLDRDIDKVNPRTQNREIPAGVISSRSALTFVILSSLFFIATTWLINPLVFKLSPVALVVVLGYSYTKRFTYLCHFVLGAGLGLAPIGAYLAAGGGFDLIPIVLSFSVLFWVSGFDIIYALQDESFDKENKLNSIPAALGKAKALRLSEILHVISGLLIIAAAYLLQQTYPEFGWMTWVATAVFVFMLIYQHSIVKPDDLSRVNLAFFTTNGIASLVFGTLMILDIFV